MPGRASIGGMTTVWRQAAHKKASSPVVTSGTIRTNERFQLPERFKAMSSETDRPVYLKRSSSPRRPPSIYIPRMRDPDDLIKMDRSLICAGDGLGSAMPLFSIASASCDYYALRLPLLKAGFKRVLAPPSSLATNLVWGKSMPFRRFKTSRRQEDGSQTTRYSLHFAEATTPEQQQNIDSLTMVNVLQQFNHFPLSHRNLGSKKGMASNIALAAAAIEAANGGASGSASTMYRFVPRTWFYPAQKAELAKVFRDSPASAHFIWKPSLGSCGRGIWFSKGGAANAKSWEALMRRIDDKAADEEGGKVFRQYVVQDYVENPLLLDGRKMDLRLYVAVTSYDPLMVYVHEEGLVRLAAAVYGGSDDLVASAVPGAQASDEVTDSGPNTLEGRFKHLTNYSIGRKYGSTRTCDGATGSTASDQGVAMPDLKWSFDKLWAYLDDRADVGRGFAQVRAGSTPSAWVREQIALLIVRTFMSAKPTMVNALNEVTTPGRYFELYGVDVMLDANLTPWLIEINTLPSLESSSAFDYATKTNVVADLLNVAMLEPFPRSRDSFKTYRHSQNGQSVNPMISPRIQKLLAPSTAWASQELKLTAAERQTEMKTVLDDAFHCARGFKRIFPPVSPSAVCVDGTQAAGEYPLLTNNRELRGDVELFSSLGFLTSNDRSLLASL